MTSDGKQSEPEPAFSFSGGGFLMPYFVGVVDVLKGVGLIKPGKTTVAGSSAGSLIAVGATCNLDSSVLMECVMKAGKECEPGVRGRLGNALRKQLEQVLPKDAHEQCKDIAHVGITRMSTAGQLLKSKVISDFESREDLLHALLASCHIPVLSDGNLTTKFRGKSAMDGGLTALMPIPPESESRTVKVSCLSKPIVAKMPLMNRKLNLLGIEHGIAPGNFQEWPHSMDETFKFALNPQPTEFLTNLQNRGRTDAQAWLAKTGWEAKLNGGPPKVISLEATPGSPGSPEYPEGATGDGAAAPQDPNEVLARNTSLHLRATGGPQ